MLIVIIPFFAFTAHETGERDALSSSGTQLEDENAILGVAPEDCRVTNWHDEDNIKAPYSDIGDTSELEDKGTSELEDNNVISVSTSSKLCKDVSSTAESKGASTDVESTSADINTASILSKKISYSSNRGKVKSVVENVSAAQMKLMAVPQTLVNRVSLH